MSRGASTSSACAAAPSSSRPPCSPSRWWRVTLVPTILGAVGVADPPQIAVDVAGGRPQLGPGRHDPGRASLSTRPAPDASRRTTQPPTRRLARDARRRSRGCGASAVRNGELDGLLTITRDDDGELAFDYLSTRARRTRPASSSPRPPRPWRSPTGSSGRASPPARVRSSSRRRLHRHCRRPATRATRRTSAAR